ncbi:MAG: DUF1573 domain-containing protein [Planctomycetota bacterium]
MRTVLLVLVCLGAGFGFAKYRHFIRHKAEKNVFGLQDADISQVSDSGSLKALINKSLQRKSGQIDVVNGAEYDFGIMMAGATRSHEFIFKNVGDAAAKIRFLKSTCKCTVGKFEQAVLKPGEETKVELEWKAIANFREFSQSATIGTDCPGQEEIQLKISGQVVQGYVLEPPGQNLGEVFTNVERIATVKIFSLRDEPMDLVGGKVEESTIADLVRIEIGEESLIQPGEIPEKSEAKRVVEAKITLLPGLPAGPINTNIKFLRKDGADGTEESDVPAFPITGRGINNMRVIAGDDYNESRNVLNLGTAKASQGLKKKLMLAVRKENADAEPKLRVESITPSEISVTIGEPSGTASQRIFPITFEIPAGSNPIERDGTFNKDFGKIVLETDSEVVARIPIYLKFKVTE